MFVSCTSSAHKGGKCLWERSAGLAASRNREMRFTHIALAEMALPLAVSSVCKQQEWRKWGRLRMRRKFVRGVERRNHTAIFIATRERATDSAMSAKNASARETERHTCDANMDSRKRSTTRSMQSKAADAQSAESRDGPMKFDQVSASVRLG